MSGRKRQYRENIKCIICHMIFDNDHQVKGEGVVVGQKNRANRFQALAYATVCKC